MLFNRRMIDKVKALLSGKFAKDTIWLTLAQIVLIVSGLSVNLIIGSEFGEATLGVFNQVLSLYVICTVLFSLGINASLVQKIAYSETESFKLIFSSGLFITLVSSVVLASAIYVIIEKWPGLLSSNEVKQGFSYTLVGIPFFALNKNFQAFYSGRKNQKYFSIIRGLRWIIILSFLSINSVFFKSIDANYYILPLTEIFLFILVVIINYHYLTLKIKKSFLLENLNFGLKSYVAELFTILNDRLDIVIIGYFLTQSQTGLFSFYIFFVKALFIFPGILNQNFKPIFAKQWNLKNLASIESSIHRLKKINLIITITSSIFIIIGYYLLVNLFYTDYQSTFNYLLISILSAIPAALISWGGGLLLMAGKLKENILRTFIILSFNVLSLIILTSLIGIDGAVLASCLSFVFTFFMLKNFVKRIIGVNLI